MAGNIKGITIEFRGETTKLDSALRQIDKETRSLDKELSGINKALKFNPTSVDLWRQKQTVLAEKVKETQEKLKLLKQQQADMKARGIDENSEEYRKLQREIITTESKLKTFEGQLKSIGNVKLQALSKQFEEVGNKLQGAADAVAPFSAAGGAVAAAVGGLAVSSSKAADDLNTLSKRYHLSTQELQLYKAAAETSDVSVEAIAKSHVKLTKTMNSAANGNKSAAENFKKLGVEVTDASGNLRSADDVWKDTIAALGKIPDETERDALAMSVLGKAASELNPIIADGGEAYSAMAAAMEKYNLDFLDQETLDKANQFNDQLQTMKSIGEVAFQTLGAKLAEFMLPALEKLGELVGKFAEWLSGLSPEVVTVIGIIGALVAGLFPLLMIAGKIAMAVSAITGVMATLGVSFAAVAAPIGIAVAAIAAAIAIGVLLYKNWDKIKATAAALWVSVKAHFEQMKNAIARALMAVLQTVSTIWNNIKARIGMAISNIKTAVSTGFNAIKSTATSIFNSLKSTVSSVWNGIKSAITKPIETAKNTIKTAIDKIKSIISGVKFELPHFKLPHFIISGGKMPWGIGGQGKAPTIDVKWYKQGGIFDSPSLIGIGEAGAEAVIPLDTLWKKMDAIAAATSSGGIVINVYASPGMDVKELAAEVRREIIAAENRRRLAWQ